ncbi:MAG TPA: TIGR02281 family clan AA aspartic protease [Beijerinckiaceae bacterium]|jgi:aspartyl protease family protein
MPGAVGLSVVLLAMALLVANRGGEPILGLAPGEFASVASLGAMALLVASLIVSEFRGRWVNGLRALILWGMIIVALVGFYSYRFELQQVASRLAGEFMPGETTVTPGGEVVVTRRMDGSFVVNGKANDRDLRFIFDTGASTVVLTSESARAVGLDPSTLTFMVPVSTANGMTLAAPVTIDRLAVGSIREQRVRALVTKPGVLRENLLGMTFLERLASYEVRQNRLFLRGRGV